MSGSRAMEQWRNFFESSGEDIWTIIERAIIVAHTDYPDQLCMRRDGFTERMYAPHLAQTKWSDEVLSKGLHSGKANAMREVSKTNKVKENDDKGVDSSKDEHEDEAPNEYVQIDSSDVYEVADDDDEIDVCEDDGAAEEVVQDDAFDENQALEHLLSEIYSIKSSMKDIHQPEAEVMDLLCRVQELNIPIEVLKVTFIGKSVNKYRHHLSRAVQLSSKKIIKSWKILADETDEWTKSVLFVASSANNENVAVDDDEGGWPSREIVKSWKNLVVEWRKKSKKKSKNMLAVKAASALEQSSALDDDKGGQPSRPFHDGGLVALQTMELIELSTFTDDHLPAVSQGPCPPTSDGLSDSGNLPLRQVKVNRSDHHQGGRRSSSRCSPDQDQGTRESNGVASVSNEVDKRRSPNAKIKIDQNLGSTTGPLYPGLVSDSTEKLEALKRKLRTNYRLADKQRKVHQLKVRELPPLIAPPKRKPNAKWPGQNRGRMKVKSELVTN